MVITWKKSKSEITPEKLEALGVEPGKVKLRKAKTSHDRAKKIATADKQKYKNNYDE